MKKISYVFVLSAFLIASCDKIEDPFQDATQSNPVDTTTEEIIKKILIEDYTGHTCGNCPEAAVIADDLQKLYGDKVVVVSVHVGGFAEPYPTGDKYRTDFRTPAGNAYENEFGPNLSLPTGTINRLNRNQSIVQGRGTWGTIVEEIKDEQPAVQLTLEGSYTESSRELTVDVTAKGLLDLAGTYKLILQITENNIVDWQTNYDVIPSDIEDYTHKHVLRDNINSTWGDVFFANGITIDDEVSSSFNYTLNSDWDDSECHIVGYLYDESTYEIIQVEEISVK